MEYELVHEIKNLCRNNQMRDIFYEEVECDDPVSFVRERLMGREVELSADFGAGGNVTVHGVCVGLIQTFTFTPI